MSEPTRRAATPEPRTRPWLVTGRVHKYEWNGRRFGTRERAMRYVERLYNAGCWSVKVEFAPLDPREDGTR